ncbi:uncharacterized protein V6R79_000509 [Siganus canaliculatus]
MKSCRCFASYRSHIYRKHRDLVLGAAAENECWMDYMDNDGAEEDVSPDVLHQQNVVQSTAYKTEDLVTGLKRNLCLFILKIREKHCFPSAVHTSIVEDLRTIFDSFLSHYTEAMWFHLQNINISVNEDDDLQELLSQTNVFEDCIRAINTEWTLEQYCSRELGMVKPIEIHLKNEDETTKATLQYVPLLSILQKVAENEDAWAMLTRDVEPSSDDYDEVLQPLLSDVESLETHGVLLKCGREEKLFRGTIATISADNLSAHAVAGLTKNFSSGRICRFCNATKQDISEKFSEAEFILRNSENYSYQLKAVEDNPGNTNIYGIKNACCFSKLKFVASPVVYLFPPDIMHDLLEGTIPVSLVLLLKQLVKEKQISLAQLNYEIQHFPYGVNDKTSKPPPIPEHALRSNSLIRALQCKLGENVTPDHVIKTKAITVDNVPYKTGSCLVIGLAHAEDIPIFLKIYHIYGIIGSWYLCGKILKPSSFDSHIHSYIAEEEPHWIALLPGEELAFHGLDSYLGSDGRLTVSLRHWI